MYIRNILRYTCLVYRKCYRPRNELKEKKLQEDFWKLVEENIRVKMLDSRAKGMWNGKV